MLDWLDQPVSDLRPVSPGRSRRKAAAPLERDVQKAIVRRLRTALPLGSVVAAVQNEKGARGKTPEQRLRYGAARKASGVVGGFPDLVCLLPGAATVLVEVKRETGGVVSDAQLGLHDRLRSLGFVVVVVRSADEVVVALRAAGVALRERA